MALRFKVRLALAVACPLAAAVPQVVAAQNISIDGRFSPAQAFAAIDNTHPILTLSHNPDTAAVLDSYGASCILAGHTHGGQIRLPGYGAVMLPVQDHRLQKGLFRLQNSTLYVSRGIGFLAQARFWCRPEVPIFTLYPA